MTLLEAAYNFAKSKHEGQYRRDGVTPYFTHPEKVASLLDTEIEKSIGICHDLIEECNLTKRDFIDAGLGYIYTYIDVLSHNKYESYDDYIRRLLVYDISKKVKIADIVANLSDNPTEQQIQKYNRALRILAGVE